MTPVPFPEQLHATRGLLRELVATLEEGRTDRWYAFGVVSQRARRQVYLSATESMTQGCDRGVVLRITAGDQSFEWASNDLDPEVLREGARGLRARVEAQWDGTGPSYTPSSWHDEDLASLDPLAREQLPEVLGPEVQVHFGTRAEVHPESTTAADLAGRAREAREAVLARAEAEGAALAVVTAGVTELLEASAFVDRHRDMSQAILSTSLRATSISTRGQQVHVSAGGHGGIERARLPSSKIDYVALMPARLDQAERLAPGRYPVITSPEVTGVLAHEAFGHTQEGDTRALGRSCASALQRTGDVVGAPGASIMSNAAVYGADEGHWGNGSMFFDDEGQLARPQIILDDGVVSDPMNDLMSSLVGDEAGRAPRRCNGRRESWRRPIMARQTNTYFTPGESTLDELIARVDHGFLAIDAWGGMEDPKGMSLTAGAVYLEEIRDGARTGRLFLGPSGGNVELSDPVPTILAGLMGKTADWRVSAGGCQKYHKEFVTAGIGGPWILWEGITCG